jgi:cysteine-rich repeat protein
MNAVRRAVVAAVLVVVGAGCPLSSSPLSARYACRLDAPACPEGLTCLVAADAELGFCGATSACTASDGKNGGIARLLSDGTPCGAPNDDARPVCREGRCTVFDDCNDEGRPASCGDGCLDLGEACDDGNDTDGDGCGRSCQRECGDGVVVGDEQCDDGNDNPVDGCDACRLTAFAVEPLVVGSVDGVRAAEFPLDIPLGITTAPGGEIYVADSRHHRVLRFAPDAAVRAADAIVVAGSGVPGFSGDGGTALQAQLCLPTGVAVDPFGNLYIADSLNHRIRRVDQRGTITTIAGSTGPGGECSFDGGGIESDSFVTDPLRTRFDRPLGLVVDPRDLSVIVLDTGNRRLRRLTPEGPLEAPVRWSIATLPLDTTFSDGSELFVQLGPSALAQAPDGALFVADTFADEIVRVDPSCLTAGGTCRTLRRSLLDANVAFQLPRVPFALHVTDDGTVVVSELLARKVETFAASAWTTASGTTILQASTAIKVGGTEVPAAPLNVPGAVTSSGADVFVADPNEGRVLRLRNNGTRVEQVMGRIGPRFLDGEPASEASLLTPSQLAVDATGALYAIEALHHVVRRFADDGSGTVVTKRVAGNGKLDLFSVLGNGRVGGPVTRPAAGRCTGTDGLDVVSLTGTDSAGPEGVAVFERADGRRSVFVADTVFQQILRFDDDGRVCDVASAGDVDEDVQLSPFTPLFLHLHENLLVVADAGAGRIQFIELDGQGNRVGRVDTRSLFQLGTGSVLDVLPLDEDVVLVADPATSTVWRYQRSAQTLVPFVPRSGEAPSPLATPIGLARCGDGRILIADGGDVADRGVTVHVVSPAGDVVGTLAGAGERGLSGDFGPASAARLHLARPRPDTPFAPVGIVCADDGTVYVSERESARIRRISPDGVITTFAGRTAPEGPGPAGRARLYAPMTFVGRPADAAVPPGLVVVDGSVVDVSGAGGGRVVVVADEEGGGPLARIAVGYDRAAPALDRRASLAPLLDGARGAAWDVDRKRLVITQSDAEELRVIDALDDDPTRWTEASSSPVGVTGLAGIALDPTDGSFVVADEAHGCVRRLSADLALDPVAVVGPCAPEGPPLLDGPTHVAFSASGALYIAETARNRVVRVDDVDGQVVLTTIVGNGEAASAGEEAPAREQAIASPRQIVFDAWGNLWVTSTKTVRVVLNRDDDDAPDGDDRVVTAYGANREAYPERDSICVEALAPAPVGLRAPDGTIAGMIVGDSCLGTATWVTTVRRTP